MERRVIEAFAREGITVKRGHSYDSKEQHGFISSQRMGMDVFKNIPPDAKLIVAEAVGQYMQVRIPCRLNDTIEHRLCRILTICHQDGVQAVVRAVILCSCCHEGCVCLTIRINE